MTKLRVPHFQQTTSYTCIPACIRMVLAYYGKQHSEQDLAFAFQTVPLVGTLPENVIPVLEEWGHNIRWFERGSIEQLTKLLAQNFPVILFVRAADLPQKGTSLHALVLVQMDSRSVVLLDPTQKKELRLSIKRFIHIWTNFGNEGIVIW